ncbi:MAG: flagellar basal body rod protein FlgC [Betaproteobacteria bacterium]|nr:flagellar basal body rod protein FlgC [Betaproteobacteria bacterium]NBT75628.1 flagellar basal body rod protein FlgC [Betaproteobacteria bacterium]NBY14450.1 flagellar basal body rod protein FlgC [Betaproteobacteria bacterium]NCA16076.1 flagellar basal body rod protein FlgC [Betaproteobacteria bacterium]NDF04249.1 flagellar basal body rod protein FlgC [Betaproteobacteria bacterium]
MIDNIFGVAGTALHAQLTRMNLTASNLANQNTTAPTEDGAFKAKRSVFKALMQQSDTHAGAQYVGGVRVANIVDLQNPNPRVYEPGSPNADKDGYVYMSNVNEVTEMVEMMAAARAYQNNVEVVNTAKALMMKTLEVTKA